MKKLLTIICLLFALAMGAAAQDLSSSDIAKIRASIPQLKQKAAAGDHTAMESLVQYYQLEKCAVLMENPSLKNLGVSKYLTEDKIIEYAQICVEDSKDCQDFLMMWPTLKIMAQQATTLTAKYGSKAYNSIRKGKVYGGMPGAILTEYKTVEQDGSRYAFYKYAGSFVDRIGSYKKYVPNSVMALANSLGNICPKIIKVRNGKVANIIW